MCSGAPAAPGPGRTLRPPAASSRPGAQPPRDLRRARPWPGGAGRQPAGPMGARSACRPSSGQTAPAPSWQPRMVAQGSGAVEDAVRAAAAGAGAAGGGPESGAWPRAVGSADRAAATRVSARQVASGYLRRGADTPLLYRILRQGGKNATEGVAGQQHRMLRSDRRTRCSAVQVPGGRPVDHLAVELEARSHGRGRSGRPSAG